MSFIEGRGGIESNNDSGLPGWRLGRKMRQRVTDISSSFIFVSLLSSLFAAAAESIAGPGIEEKEEEDPTSITMAWSSGDGREGGWSLTNTNTHKIQTRKKTKNKRTKKQLRS
jgi:hypothetical protein